MFRFCFFLLVALLLPPFTYGASFDLAPNLTLELDIDLNRWQVGQQPPEQVIRMTAGGDGPALLEKTRRILALNELFVWAPGSGAYLMVDISPLEETEKSPSRRAIRSSARYAAQSLEAEGGVTEVRTSIRKTSMAGLTIAYQLQAEYNKNGQPHGFIGVIGFTPPYRVYLYYNDPLTDVLDYADMEKILDSARFHRKEAS